MYVGRQAPCQTVSCGFVHMRTVHGNVQYLESIRLPASLVPCLVEDLDNLLGGFVQGTKDPRGRQKYWHSSQVTVNFHFVIPYFFIKMEVNLPIS